MGEVSLTTIIGVPTGGGWSHPLPGPPHHSEGESSGPPRPDGTPTRTCQPVRAPYQWRATLPCVDGWLVQDPYSLGHAGLNTVMVYQRIGRRGQGGSEFLRTGEAGSILSGITKVVGQGTNQTQDRRSRWGSVQSWLVQSRGGRRDHDDERANSPPP